MDGNTMFAVPTTTPFGSPRLLPPINFPRASPSLYGPSLTPQTSPKRPNSSPSPSPPNRPKRRHSASATTPIASRLNMMSLPDTPVRSLNHDFLRPPAFGAVAYNLGNSPPPSAAAVDSNSPEIRLSSPTHQISSPASHPTSSRPTSSRPTSSRVNPDSQVRPQSSASVPSSRDEREDAANNEDPLRALPEIYNQGYMGSPRLRFFAVRNDAADVEFEHRLCNSILEYVKERYDSFVLILTHAGYQRESSVPVVLLCAHSLSDADARQVTEIFNATDCRVIRRLFCFEGRTEGQFSNLAHMTKYQQRPSPGSSIGPVGCDRSSSMGPYVAFDGDDSVYSISVHHGLKDDASPITETQDAPLIIQQPSSLDFNEYKATLEHGLLLATEGVRRNRRHLDDLQAELDNLVSLDCKFGTVVGSEFCAVMYEGHLINSDVCVIKTISERVGKNRLALDNNPGWVLWHPRDNEGNLILSGGGSLELGTRVAKVGKATAATQGTVEFRYAKAKLGGATAEYTSEFCVLSDNRLTQFSDAGDSGGAVVNETGEVVGMILGGTYGFPKMMEGHEALGEVFFTYVTPWEFVAERVELLMGKYPNLLVDSEGLEKYS